MNSGIASGKRSGIITGIKFLKTGRMKSKKKEIKYGFYELYIDSETEVCYYKRDLNHNLDILGKKIKYNLTQGRLIYDSNITGGRIW